VAENQLDSHRDNYYSICRGTYERIAKCYKEIRQTNEETDKCATEHRQLIGTLQQNLTQSLAKQCQWLEKCTAERCLDDERDIECLNACGREFEQSLSGDFGSVMSKYLDRHDL